MSEVSSSRPSRRVFLRASAAFLGLACGPTVLADGALDATALGVDGASGSDQSRALAAALDRARAEARPLYLPPGRYPVTGVELPAGARLVGMSGTSRLVAAGAGPLLRARGVADVALRGLVLEGAGSAGEEALALFEEVSRLSVAECGLRDSAGNGLKLTGCSGEIRDCTIAGAAAAGLFAIDGQALDIAGNTVEDCGNNGILVWQSASRHDGALVRHNRISGIRADAGGTGQNGNAVNVFRGGGVRVVDNDIADCAFSAVRNNAGSDIIIARNACRALGEVAIYAEFGFEGALISDNVVRGAAQGVSVTNFSDGGRLAVIAGNLIRDIVIGGVPEDRGIGIGVEADAAVTGNVVDGAAHAGLALGWGPHLRDVTASGNVIRRARFGIAVSVAEGAGRAVISGNLVAESGEAAIAGFAWDELVERDLAGNADAYPQLTVAGNEFG